MVEVDQALLEKDLERDEGIRQSVYKDSLGFLTIGVGRLIDSRKGGHLSLPEISFLLRNDISDVLADIKDETWFSGCETEAQKRALANLRFQLGGNGLRSFTTFLNLMSQKKFKEAAEDLRGTKWYSQVPERAERICLLIAG